MADTELDGATPAAPEDTVTQSEPQADTAEETTDEGSEQELDGAEDPADAEQAEDEGGETDSGQPAAKPASRAQGRIQRLAAELKAERDERERLISERAVAQAQLEHLRQQQHAAQSMAEQRAEEERLSLLDPQERALYQANQQIRNMEYRLNQIEVRRKDDFDRANFHAKAQHDPTFAKYADEVETMYQDGVSRGVSAAREDLLAYRLGKELLQNKNSEEAKKKASASKRIDSVTAKPASARGDVAGAKKGKSVEDRLSGVLI